MLHEPFSNLVTAAHTTIRIAMRLRKPVQILVALAIIAASALFTYRYTRAPQRDSFAVLSYLPRDPDTVIYVDIAALRQSPFFAQFAAWLPQSTKDPDYAQFVSDTGFNFERDLDSLAIAEVDPAKKGSLAKNLVFVGEGNFDRKRIIAYAQGRGALKNRNGRDVIQLPGGIDWPGPNITFLSDRIILQVTNSLLSGQYLDRFLAAAKNPAEDKDWGARFERLGGSPVFAVFHGFAPPNLNAHVGSMSSPQLLSLVAQLQWLTIAAKPDADQLRLVVEGESASESTQRQLADVLNGVVILAQAGLNDPKVRQQLAPDVRQACLELLKSADISRIDRGETKSVRLILSLTPQFLEAARHQSTFVAPPKAAPPPPASRKSSSRKSGT